MFQVLKTTGWGKCTWRDDRLKWNPEDFGDIDRLSVNTEMVRILPTFILLV